jgi:two-component system, NarL family, response regulator NreC
MFLTGVGVPQRSVKGLPNSVVVADDHPVARAGLCVTLRRAPDEFEVVAEAWDVTSTLTAVRDHHPALLLLDLMMPGGSTIAALPRILIASPMTAVMVVTFYDDPSYARAAIASGARGFALKEASSDELLLAFRTAAAGRHYVHPRVGAALAEQSSESEACRLSEREIEVVRLIALGHTNAEIAEMTHLAERTIKVARATAMEKTGALTRAELTAYAERLGLVGRAAARSA